MKVKLVESENELLEILELQHQNHIANVPVELRKANGFVTVRHDLDLLIKMNDHAPQVVAIDQGRVVGYGLVMLKPFHDAIPVLVPMFDVFKQITHRGKRLDAHNYYVMGQICISEAYRGQGLVNAIYQKHREAYSGRFNICLTEVSTSNTRSLKAHQKVGFEIIHRYRDENDEWNVLAWDWTD